MCGIAGVRRFGNAPEITSDEIRILLCSLEHRGMSATGLAIQNRNQPDDVFIYKSDDPAWKFVAGHDFNEFIEEHLTPETQTVLLHTRAATVGSPLKNENNHPIYAGDVAIIHNGGISNHNDIMGRLRAERSCETDSDAIRATLDTYGLTRKGVTELSKLAGSGAIAAIKRGQPDLLLLARSGNPLVYAEYRDKLYWASEFGAIQQAIRPFVVRHGLTMREGAIPHGVGYLSMPDNSAYMIGAEGLMWHQEMTICAGSFTAPCYREYENYETRRNRWVYSKKEEERRQLVVTIPAEEKKSPKELPSGSASGSDGKRVNASGKEIGMCPECGLMNAKENNADSWALYTCFSCQSSLAELEF